MQKKWLWSIDCASEGQIRNHSWAWPKTRNLHLMMSWQATRIVTVNWRLQINQQYHVHASYYQKVAFRPSVTIRDSTPIPPPIIVLFLTLHNTHIIFLSSLSPPYLNKQILLSPPLVSSSFILISPQEKDLKKVYYGGCKL